MKATRLFTVLMAVAILWPTVHSHAAGDAGLIMPANNELKNTNSLQRGARNFMSYCVGCHALKYVRYNRLAEDLGLSEEQVLNNLIFGIDRVNANVTTAMTKSQASQWFNAVPPDLSLTARSRGVDWIYSYLKAFYVDDDRAFGVNNLLLEGSSMPHVLWELQGLQKAVYRTEKMVDDDGREDEVAVFDHFEQLTEGTLSPKEYDGFIRDTVNFLDYVGEPMKMHRQSIGMMVLGFLAVFLLLAYELKKEYWKDVH